MVEPRYMSLSEAARRVRMSKRQIQRWVEGGMPIIELQGVGFVREDVLLEEFRKRRIGRRKYGKGQG